MSTRAGYINGKRYLVRIKPRSFKKKLLSRGRATVYIETMEGTVKLSISESRLLGRYGYIEMRIASMGESALIAVFPEVVDGGVKHLSFSRTARNVKLIEVK